MELAEEIANQNQLMSTVSGIRTQGPHSTWLKAQFRKSFRWRSFCKSLIIVRGSQCERCHKTENLVVHHRDPLHYDDLTASKFVVLCNSCHLVVESQCRNEETMRQHPENERFHTLYPYDRDPVKWQSGTGTQLKWKRERLAEINKPEYTPTKQQAKEALEFMRQHPELFQ